MSAGARAKLSAALSGLDLVQRGRDDLNAAAWLYALGMDRAAQLRIQTGAIFIEAAIADGLQGGQG